MSLKSLKALVAIKEHGSFAAAAEQLCLTQSAISQQISALEKELGFALFERSGRSPLLNSDGHEVYQRAKQLLDNYRMLGDGLGPHGGLSGTLAVGAIYTVQVSSLAPVLAQLREQYPGLHIKIFRGMSADLVARVENGELDAVLVTGPPVKQARDCRWDTLSHEHFYVISLPEYPETAADDILQNYPFIRFDPLAWAGIMIDEELRRQKLRLNEMVELDSLQAALEMVQQRLGVTVMPLSSELVSEIGDSFRLTPFGSPHLSREVGLYQRRQHARSHLTHLILQEMENYYAQVT